MREKNLSNYKAVILAGGKGTRLYPVTKEIPKPLLSVRRKPIINYLADLFFSYGVKDIAVLINKEFKQEFDWWIQKHYSVNPVKENSQVSSWQDDFDSPKDFPNIKLFVEAEPMGTFGGLWFLKNWIAGSPFFMTNGDELKQVDLGKMAEIHQIQD